jgi:phage protein U
MAEIGFYGEDIVFETSDQRILTFNDFKHEVASRWESHVIIGKKPLLEFTGPELETISFTVLFKADLGVKPSEELQKWRDIVQEGKANVLAIGGVPIGDDLWICESVSEAYSCVWSEGELYSARIDVSLKEYISELGR